MNPSTPASLRVSRHLSASADRVFDAWIAPAIASRWLFATPGGDIVRCDLDARAGGDFVITRRDGEDVEHVGRYVEVDRPRRLAFTFGVPKYSSEVTTVVVAVSPDLTGCELVLEHYDVPAEWVKQTEEGWRVGASTGRPAAGGSGRETRKRAVVGTPGSFPDLAARAGPPPRRGGTVEAPRPTGQAWCPGVSPCSPCSPWWESGSDAAEGID